MPVPTDPASAAGRLKAGAEASVPAVLVPTSLLRALLPVLDAVARGAEGDRLERWAAAFDALAQGRRNDLHIIIADPRVLAAAAIALADAEAAARRRADDDAAYRWVREIYEASGGATPALREAYTAYQTWERGTAASPPSTRP